MIPVDLSANYERWIYDPNGSGTIRGCSCTHCTSLATGLGPCFSGGPRWSEGPDCPDVLFCRFPRRLRDFCEGFGCFRLSFGPRGPSVRGGLKTPRGHSLRPLATSLRGPDSSPDSSRGALKPDRKSTTARGPIGSRGPASVGGGGAKDMLAPDEWPLGA